MKGNSEWDLIETRDYIISVVRKEVSPIDTKTFKKIINILADPDEEIQQKVEKYNFQAVSALLHEYVFRDKKDYITKMKYLKETEYKNEGLTMFGQFNDIINKKIFDNPSIKTSWIISDLGEAPKMDIRHKLNYVFVREKGNLDKLCEDILVIVRYTKNENQVLYMILEEYLFTRKFKSELLLKDIFERELSRASDEEIKKVEKIYQRIEKSKTKKIYISTAQQWLYEKTGKPEYMNTHCKTIFLV